MIDFWGAVERAEKQYLFHHLLSDGESAWTDQTAACLHTQHTQGTSQFPLFHPRFPHLQLSHWRREERGNKHKMKHHFRADDMSFPYKRVHSWINCQLNFRVCGNKPTFRIILTSSAQPVFSSCLVWMFVWQTSYVLYFHCAQVSVDAQEHMISDSVYKVQPDYDQEALYCSVEIIILKKSL